MLTCITVVAIAVMIRHHQKPLPIPGNLRIGKKEISELVFKDDLYNPARIVRNREVKYWERSISQEQLKKIRERLLNAIKKIPETDWDEILFQIFLQKSSCLKYYLADGKLDVDAIKKREELGITHAYKIIQKVPLKHINTLRDYYHILFRQMIKKIQHNDWLYLCGYFRVMALLKSYQPSKDIFLFPLQNKENQNRSKIRKLTVFERLSHYYTKMEKRRAKFRSTRENDNIRIRFNLNKIESAGNIVYRGSLVNCLFLELRERLNVLTGNETPIYKSITLPMLEGTSVSYDYNGGYIYLVKHLAVDDGVPNELFVEFEDIADNDPIIRYILAYKIYVEGNG